MAKRVTTKPVAKKPVKKPAIAKTKRSAVAPSLHRVIVMQLRHTAPFGKPLTKALQALDLDEDSEAREQAALGLVDAVELTPQLLASVTTLGAYDVEDIKLLGPAWEGEEDPFPIGNLDELLALPNLERLACGSAMPSPPLDATPLLALPRLRHVELWEGDYVLRGMQRRWETNKKARAQLEAAGFRLSPASGESTWIFERALPP